ncbi:MAG: PIG-L deacetylase family protein [Acidimicrobiales bacterium]
MTENASVDRVLLVAAHPDDAEFGAGGTVSVWTDAGIEVAYLVVTDGDAGSPDPTVDRRALAALRRDEQTAAAKTLGVDRVDFLGYPDGQVETTRELRRDISRAIRLFRPDRVVCPSPERRWDFLPASHPDHLVTGEAAVRAVYPDARNWFAHPELLEEGLEPFTVRELWVVGHPDPNVAVDVTDAFARKIAALRCHASQVGGVDDLPGNLRARLERNASEMGLKDGRLAETFRVVVAR